MDTNYRELLMGDGFQAPRRYSRFCHVRRLILTNLRRYLNSLDSLFALGLFNSTTAALVNHKLMMIRLHRPLSVLGLLVAGPCLFVFDLMTLVILHNGLSSKKLFLKGISGIVALLLMICSATFASLYLEGNTELNWSRSVEVLNDWKFFSKLMAQGNSGFRKIFALYLFVGGVAIVLRLLWAQRYTKANTTREKFRFEEIETPEPTPGPFQRILGVPFLRLILFLLCITMLLPPSPWRHLTATLGYDVVHALSTVMLSNYFYGGSGCSSAAAGGSHPLGDLKYNPADDPYYISNLDQPIDDFILSAFEDTKFTNIVHITLESMRDDSFPYQEDGLLHQHIIHNMEPVEGGTPVNTETVTPFIASLAEHTVSWNTMWSTVPYTHKAMLGYWCGMMPVPMDWAVESQPPAKWYQHCLPQILRYMSSVTGTESELMDVFMNDSRPRTTDQWETVHIQSSTGEWDNGKEIIKGTGFNSAILGEQLKQLNGGIEFPCTFGYFDEESIKILWKYVDNAKSRFPKNRMYLSWKTSATHTPLHLPPEWESKNHQNYLKKGDNWELWTNREHLPIDQWLNALRWTDDIVKEFILGFRERGLEDETLFMMYNLLPMMLICSHGDHGIPFLGNWRTPVNNPHNEPYRVPFMFYNPRIKNPTKKIMKGNYYQLSIPPTVLDLMIHTNSFEQNDQKDLARRFAANYEHAQSLLRPINETIRFFSVDPGGNYWVVDNGRNLRIKFELTNDHVRLVDYVKDPLEHNQMEMWGGVEALISARAEEIFGVGTTEFLREAHRRQEYMRKEIIRRYGMEDVYIPF